MKKIRNLIFTLILIGIGSVSITLARTYPVQKVIGPFCQNANECEIPLPHISGANYLTYQDNPLYRRIYTVLRGGTYFGGRDFGLGAHKGVDIASKNGTPISAIGSGTVIFAGNKGDRGKVITIQHHFAGKSLYSNYAHLDEILVQAGDKVKEGQLIGKMGTSGNSTGPHLHFQIDTTEGKHPYHPGNCGGETLTQNVNEARCRNLVKQNTLDPILFIETQGKILEAEYAESTKKTTPSLLITSKDLEFHLETPIRMENKTFLLTITTPNKTEGGFLAQELTITGSGLSISPSTISYISNTRKIYIKTATPGQTQLSITQGDKLIKTYYLRTLDQTTLQELQQKTDLIPGLSQIIEKALK